MCGESDGTCDVYRETRRVARKSHTCYGCDETIEPGHKYLDTATLHDGGWSCWKHCQRCEAMFEAIVKAVHYGTYVDPGFMCGEMWDDNFGPPPPEIEALAFMLPGDIDAHTGATR